MTNGCKGSMMRVTSALVDDLKILKTIKASNGRIGTHNDLLHSLVMAELKKTHARIQDGYVTEGSLVMSPSGKPVIIGRISVSEVVFTDGTYVINGSKVCNELKLLADTVSTFEGELFLE